MPKITIEIPNGIRTADGVIDMAPDADDNWLYINTDEGLIGAPLAPFEGKIGARLHFSVEKV